MKSRGALLITILLSMSVFGGVEINDEDTLETSTQPRLVDLSGPLKIHDLGEPVRSVGEERDRTMAAYTPIGTFTLATFIPSQEIQQSLATERPDLTMLIISDRSTMWDARVAIDEVPGVQIRTAVPPSGFLVQGEPNSLTQAASLDVVASSHKVPTALLVHPAIAEAEELTMIEVLGWNTETGERSDHSAPLDLGDLSDMNLLGFEDTELVDDGRRWGFASKENIPQLALNPAVSWISPIDDIRLSNDQVRDHTESEDVTTWFSSTLDGSGQIIAVGDSGIDHDHGDFGSRIISRTSVTPGDSSTADGSGHGTHVACTAAGSGYRSSGQYAGVAPEAEIVFQAMEDDDSGNLYSYGIDTMLVQAYNEAARFHTNSWGSGSGFGSYTTSAEDADDRISTWDQYWQYEGMTVLFSAGNEGSNGISPPATAKNVIAVGAHQNRYSGAPDAMYPYSSEGPTDDGRIKPDVIAPGMYVRSCQAQESGGSSDLGQWYEESSGTSMATPAAAGASILIREYLMEIAERPAPQASLIKAMLILGAEDIGTPNIPNNVEGWGRIDLTNSLVPDSDVGIFVDDRHRLRSGEYDDYSFDVTRSGEPLKVVLAWSDYPGSSSSTDQLRNDLNLEVISPDGSTTYIGNVFSQGRSVTGGQPDSTNNVEVALIESAGTGVWTVRVSDVYHSGARQYQPYSIAIRGVNVNDLTPDPTVDPDSFSLSTPIPQVGEAVTVGASIVNLGAGSVPSLSITASAAGQPLGVRTISMAPGESVPVEWDWTPTASGNIEVTIEVDPTDQVEETAEDNNLLSSFVLVSEPGIRVDTMNPNPVMTDPRGTTSFDIQLTNTALFPTNASISASSVIRLSDGAVMPWYSSFSLTQVQLNASETEQLTFALTHPNPPEPGIYRIIVTGLDTENDVTSELILKLTVSSFPDIEFRVPGGILAIDAFEPTEAYLQLSNEGNGPQTYDLALESPAGWRATLDNLGTFVDSTHGSTGILGQGNTRQIDITLTPPSVVVSAGTLINAELTISARTTSDTWVHQIPLIVAAKDDVSLTPSPGGSDSQVRPDDTHEIPIQIVNQGNRDITLTPQILSLPGGWNSLSNTQPITIEQGSTSIWYLTIQGNGLAASGLAKVRFLTQDGSAFSWNRTIEVTSGAVPIVSFRSIVLADGSTSPSPLGLGPLPVATPFDLSWTVSNQGQGSWSPVASLVSQGDGWNTSCTPVSPVQPAASSVAWCSVIIPESQAGNAEVPLTLRLESEGLLAIDTVSILVQQTSKISWTMQGNAPILTSGESTLITLQAENQGNTQINTIIIIETPSNGWDHQVSGSEILSLSPGESRTVEIYLTVGESRGPVFIELQGGALIDGSTFQVPLQVRAIDSQGMISAWFMLAVLTVLGLAGSLVVVQLRKRRGDVMDRTGVEEEIPCFLCDSPIVVGNALACGECGARYHRVGQSGSCNVSEMEVCINCGASRDLLINA